MILVSSTLSPVFRHILTSVQVAGAAEIIWTTHVPPGLHTKDLDMASFCETVAREMVIPVGESKALNCKTSSNA